MSTRFEIRKNGERVCVAGILREGVLSVHLTSIIGSDQNVRHGINIGGLGYFDPSQEMSRYANWTAPNVTVGDEITIRILPEGDFDAPCEFINTPKLTRDDPDFGTLNYFVETWTAEIAFACPPLTAARIHLCADEAGVTESQRRLILDLIARHTDLWSDISAAIVRCHPDLQTREELESRIMPHVVIDVGRDAKSMALSYTIADDSKDSKCFVTLRNWEVVQIGMEN